MTSYKLEHVKGHQDRNKKLKSLMLEARLNVKCDGMAKQAVRASVKPGMGQSSQTLPLEKFSVFVGGEKQTSALKEAIKKMVRREAVREYHASRPAQKGGMRREMFDTVAWGDVTEALKDRSKMFKMWYAKQGTGFCGVGCWTSKWDKTYETAKEEELEASRCSSCGMKQEKAHSLNRRKNISRRAVFELKTQALEEWMSSTYTHPLLEKWLPTYLRGQGKSFQHLPNLPKAMRLITERSRTR